jgi:hypothetical protein
MRALEIIRALAFAPVTSVLELVFALVCGCTISTLVILLPAAFPALGALIDAVDAWRGRKK